MEPVIYAAPSVGLGSALAQHPVLICTVWLGLRRCSLCVLTFWLSHSLNNAVQQVFVRQLPCIRHHMLMWMFS